jgi:hypothetical protein
VVGVQRLELVLNRLLRTIEVMVDGKRTRDAFSAPDGKSLRQAEGLLRSGRWSIASQQTRWLKRSIPIALVRDSAVLPPHMGGHAFAAKDAASRAESDRLKWRSLDVANPEESSEDFAADVWLLRHTKKWLLFDLSRSEVLRWHSVPYGAEYVRLRRTYERHVSSVPFRTTPSPMRIIEPMVRGTMLKDLRPEARTATLRTLLLELAELVRHEGQRRVTDPAPIALEEMLRLSPIEEARVRHAEVVELIEGVPQVPVHSEQTGTNILVDERGAAVRIDFDEIHEGPFWRDPIRLVATDLDGWISGIFDNELAAIWRAADEKPEAWDHETINRYLRIDALERIVRGRHRTWETARSPYFELQRRLFNADVRHHWTLTASAFR